MLRRQKLSFTARDDVRFSLADLPQDDVDGDRVTPADVLRAAARRWCKQTDECVFDFKSPRRRPHHLETVALCAKREGCDVRFRFRGSANDAVYNLSVACSSDAHSAVPRKARVSKKNPVESQPSVEERMAIRRACEHLVEQGLSVTPGSVDQLLTTRVAATVLKNTVKWWKKEMGGSTKEFRDSVESFKSFVDSRTGSGHVKFCHVDVSQNKFTWVCLLPFFFKAIKQLSQAGRADSITIACDWTHRLCHLGWEYGFVVAILWKRQGGDWRHTGWPLCAVCHPKECSVCMPLASALFWLN